MIMLSLNKKYDWPFLQFNDTASTTNCKIIDDNNFSMFS